MALEHQDSNPQVRVVFGGLNTHVSELFIENFDSPDMLNVDLDPITTIRKRNGIQFVTPGHDLASRRLWSGPGKMVKWLYRMGEQKSFLYMIRGGIMTQYNLYTPPNSISNGIVASPWTDVFLPDSAGSSYTDEVDPTDTDTWVYKGEVLYLADKLNEPIIVYGSEKVGGIDGQSSYTTTTIPGAAVKFEQSVTAEGYVTLEFQDSGGSPATHGLSDKDLVYVQLYDFGGGSDWAAINEWFSFYYVEVIDTTTIYLREGSLLRVEGDPSWAPVTQSAGSILVTDAVYLQWPMGQYGVTTGVRGYPERWVDPESVGITSANWPDYDATDGPGPVDWPSHLHVIGQGSGSRMFAYGFERDPDRIDYSELGVPYNFLKSDVFAADEGAAVTVPDIDGGYFYALRGDGDRVVSVRELLGNVVVFKTRKTLVWSGEIGEYFRISHELAVGAVNDASVVKVGNDIYFWSYDGPRRLSPSFQSQDLIDASISAEVIEVVNSLSQQHNRKIEARHERRKQRIVWHFPAAGSDENNQCLVYYYPTNADPNGRWSLWAGRYCEMVQSVAIEDPLTGQSQEYGIRGVDGCLWEMNVGTTDGEVLKSDLVDEDELANDEPTDPIQYYPIGMRYQTKWFDIESPTTHKRILTAMVIYGRDGQGKAQFFMGQEYDEIWREMKFPIAQSGNLVQPNETIFWNGGLWSGDPDVLNVLSGYPGPGDPEYVTGTGFLQNGYWNGSGRGLVVYEAEGIGRVFRILITESSTLPVSISGIVLGPSRKGTR